MCIDHNYVMIIHQIKHYLVRIEQATLRIFWYILNFLIAVFNSLSPSQHRIVLTVLNTTFGRCQFHLTWGVANTHVIKLHRDGSLAVGNPSLSLWGSVGNFTLDLTLESKVEEFGRKAWRLKKKLNCRLVDCWLVSSRSRIVEVKIYLFLRIVFHTSSFRDCMSLQTKLTHDHA